MIYAFFGILFGSSVICNILLYFTAMNYKYAAEGWKSDYLEALRKIGVNV